MIMILAGEYMESGDVAVLPKSWWQLWRRSHLTLKQALKADLTAWALVAKPGVTEKPLGVVKYDIKVGSLGTAHQYSLPEKDH